MFKNPKSKRYWILMPPFLMTALLLLYFLPDPYENLSFILIVLFWIVYYGGNYFANKKSIHRDVD